LLTVSSACVRWKPPRKLSTMPAKSKRAVKKTKKPTTATKPATKQKVVPAAAVPEKPYRLKSLSRGSFKERKQIQSEQPHVPNAFRLFGRSILTLKRHWKVFFGITIVYAILNIILVRGIGSNGDLQNLKNVLDNTLTGSGKATTGGLTLLVYLVGGSSSSSNASANAGVYQALLVILVSLVVIWTLRQVYNSQRPRVRDGFYQGTFPLVPFILVLLVMMVQLIPLLIGGLLYSTVLTNGIAVNVVEKGIWLVVFVLLALVSLYMLCSSVFALYVVTLPDMTPLKALRSTRELVRHRRFSVLRKLLFLPLSLVVLVACIMLPAIYLATPLAAWLYFVLTMLALPFIHSYLYTFYRELLPHE
jgi:hypothetical protein